MFLIDDDLIISCIERTGNPPWMQDESFYDEYEQYAEYDRLEDMYDEY